MRKTRKCAFCGKEFTCNSGSQRYCSEHCAEAAKAQRKKRQQDFLKAVQPVIDIASQEYLTFSKVAILMGCSPTDDAQAWAALSAIVGTDARQAHPDRGTCGTITITLTLTITLTMTMTMTMTITRRAVPYPSS